MPAKKKKQYTVEELSTRIAHLAEADKLIRKFDKIGASLAQQLHAAREINAALKTNEQLAEAAKLIEWMLPYLSEKAKENVDVAGLQTNAEQFLKLPIVVKVRMERVA